MKKNLWVFFCFFSLNCMEKRPAKKQKTEDRKIERIEKFFEHNIEVIKRTQRNRSHKCRAAYERLSEGLVRRVGCNALDEVEWCVHRWIVACNKGQLEQAPPVDKVLKKAYACKNRAMIEQLIIMGAEFSWGIFDSLTSIVQVSGLSEHFVGTQLNRRYGCCLWHLAVQEAYEKGSIKNVEILSYLWMALKQHIEWLDVDGHEASENRRIDCFSICYSIAKKSALLPAFERQPKLTYDEECYRTLVSIYESQHGVKGQLQNNQRLAPLYNVKFLYI